MVRRLAFFVLVSSWWIVPGARAGWECQGAEPFWHIGWSGGLIELRDSSQLLRFKSVDAAEPSGSEHWLWIYQTQSLGSRSIPLTLIVQYTGRYAECLNSAVDLSKRGRFSGIAITPARVFAGCCEWHGDNK